MTGASARAQEQHQIESAAQTTETQGTGARRIVCLCAAVAALVFRGRAGSGPATGRPSLGSWVVHAH